MRDLDALEAHARAWDLLAASLPQCLPMMTHAWFATYIERMEIPAGSWFVVLAFDPDERLLGVLPGVVQGGVVHVPCDYHTEDGDLVLAPGGEPEILEALLSELPGCVPGLRCVELGAVRVDSPTNAALERVPRGWIFVRDRAVEGSSFQIEGDVETWFSSLSKNLRSDLKRSANKIRKSDLGELSVTFLAGDDAGPQHLDDLMVLEASGWKGTAGSAIARDDSTETKYRKLAHRFAAHGMLEWHLLHAGDRLVAAHMAVRMGNKLMLLRQGSDGELTKYGVGNLLIRHAVEREFERGPGGEVNLVTDYPWCRRWRMTLTPYEQVVLAPRRPLPYLRSIFPIRMRQLARRTPGIPGLVRWLRSRGGEAERASGSR